MDAASELGHSLYAACPTFNVPPKHNTSNSKIPKKLYELRCYSKSYELVDGPTVVAIELHAIAAKYYTCLYYFLWATILNWKWVGSEKEVPQCGTWEVLHGKIPLTALWFVFLLSSNYQVFLYLFRVASNTLSHMEMTISLKSIELLCKQKICI